MVLGWIFRHKVVIALSVALLAFFIATVTLGAIHAQTENDLLACIEEKDSILESCQPPGTTAAPATTTSIGTTEPTTPKPEPEDNYRLPSTVVPILYTLHLHPDLTKETFTGKNTINLSIKDKIKEIILHSEGLTIDNIILRSGSEIIENTFVIIPKQQFLKITLSKEIGPSEDYELDIDFNGEMKNRIVGLYSSSYLDENSLKRLMATSKFEPTYARQAFPCFDEPAMKAEFKISLVRPTGDGYLALSNMNEESVENDPSTQTTTVHFEKSVPMSTYLSCFIVSDFEHQSATVNSNGVGENFEMRVFATPAQVDKVKFALDTAVAITEYYIDYFQIAYPLPKLDLAAIPDFVSGAMEHWGLVTFRETGLLYDKTISSSANKQRVASVIAHELAHMWFGNLVTMAWWNELWLNEGFASYIQYKGTEHAQPEWKTTDQFLISDLHGVLSLDATLAAHPIVQPADNPDQITELFDTITYSKGASIIRMMEDFVTPDIFRKSVTNYLNVHKYGNAVTDDLLKEIDSLITDIDVKYIMSTWTKQSGYPVVTVTPVSTTQYRLTQKRFLSNPDNENAETRTSEFNYRWYIPITYTTDVSTLQREWFKHEDIETLITVPADHKWIKLNKDQIGYYRVNYPKEMWQSLAETLRSSINSFSIADRAHLINDAFSLAEATQLDYDTALELTRYLANEHDYVPWDVASSKISSLNNLLYFTEYYSNYRKYGQNVISSAYQEVGWTVDDDHLKNLLRTTILNLACNLELTDCTKETGDRFTEWLQNPDKRPDPDLRQIIYYHGMAKAGDANKWNQMWDLFLTEQDAQEKIKLMIGLAGIQEPWILQRYIDLAWDENNVRGQDYFSCLTYISGNRIGESLVWDYVRENWQKLVDRFGLNERYLGRLIPSITGRFSTNVKLQEVEDFFARYPEAGAGAAARLQAIENIKTRIKWLENNKDNVGEWLQKNYPN